MTVLVKALLRYRRTVDVTSPGQLSHQADILLLFSVVSPGLRDSTCSKWNTRQEVIKNVYPHLEIKNAINR